MEKKLNELHQNLQLVYLNETAEINDVVGFYTELVTILAKTNELNENETTLANCIVLFVECIANFLERCESIHPNHVIALQKCLQIIGDVSKIKNYQECYVLQITIPLLQLIIRPDNLKWFNKELLRNLKTIIKDCDECLKGLLVNKNIYQFCKLIDELCICGDFEYQVLLLETIIMMFSDDLIQLHAHNLFPESQFLEDAFCKIGRNNLFYESRKFLNILNLKLKNVRSFKVEYALMDADQITPPKNLNGEPELWVDFNISSEFISIPCNKSSFPLDTLTESEDEEVQIIKILFANVVMVKMSKFQEDDFDNNDGCLILFLLKSNSVMLSSHNLSKEILKLIVFKNSDMELLEQVVLPSLFKGRFEKFNFFQQRALDVPNDEVADADTGGNSQINDKSLSKLMSTSSLSDALSLKSKLRHFVCPSYNAQKKYVSKEPNIKDVEELVASNCNNKWYLGEKSALSEDDDDAYIVDDEGQIFNNNKEDEIISSSKIELNEEKINNNEPNSIDNTFNANGESGSNRFQIPVPKKILKMFKNRKSGIRKSNTESGKFENSTIKALSIIDPQIKSSGTLKPNNSIIEISDDSDDSIFTQATVSRKHNERECELPITSGMLMTNNRKVTAEVVETSFVFGLKRLEKLRSPYNDQCTEKIKNYYDKLNDSSNRISYCKKSCEADTKSSDGLVEVLSETTISDNYSKNTLINDADNCNEFVENLNDNVDASVKCNEVIQNVSTTETNDLNHDCVVIENVCEKNTSLNGNSNLKKLAVCKLSDLRVQVSLSLQVKTTEFNNLQSENFELLRNEAIDKDQDHSEIDTHSPENDSNSETRKKQTDLRTVNDIDSPVTRCLKKPLISYKKKNKKTVAFRSVSVIIEQAAQDAVKRFIEMQTTKFISQVSNAETSKTQSSFKELNDSTFTAKKELQSTKLQVGNEEQNKKRKLYSTFDSMSTYNRATSSLRSAKKFKLYNPNNPIVVNNCDAQLSQVNGNSEINQLADRTEFLKSVEPCNKTLVADYEPYDVNVKKNRLIKSKQFLKTRQTNARTVNIGRQSTGKYILNKIDQYVANHSPKVKKFIRNGRTMSAAESKKCIDLLESLCDPCKMSDRYLFKGRDNETSINTNENLNKVLYKKRRTRYSKLKTREESNDNVDNGFNSLLKSYMKSFLETNEKIITSIKTGESSMTGENLLSTVRTLLDHDYDTYTLMQKALSNCENTEVVDVLDELRNTLEEYLESMLSRQALSGIKHHLRVVVCQRNLGILAPVFNKATDPIQQLFIDKIREYKQKSGGGNNLVDPSPEIQRELSQEIEKITRQYGGDQGVDMTQFPSFKFTDPVIDPIRMEQK
ncbi:hypothetical protein FQR65_LT07653 [Abscondita terminalis]|nr:hypothetical protein FQR65_LT07653 [Abscondita terminalis]